MEFEQYNEENEQFNWKKNKNHSIIQDLSKYNFPENIINKADIIYNKMVYRVRKNKIRQQLLFFCVYCAYLELKINVIPTELGKIFNLSTGEVQKCDSLFSPLQTGYYPQYQTISPLQYLPKYCKEFDLSDEFIEYIMKSSINIIEKEPNLLQESPQTVAAGLLKYYTYINGIVNEDNKKLKKITGRSNVTIETMFKKICFIDNK